VGNLSRYRPASQVKGHNVDYNTYEELHFSWDYFGKRPF
jgi:hypothetical protein